MFDLSRRLAALLIALLASPLLAQNANSPKKLLTPDADIEKRIKVSSDQVSVARGDGGIDVTVQGGEERYPGIDVKPDGEPAWNLSGYGHVFAQVMNTGEKAITVALRVDNKGAGETWNTESKSIKPGETQTIKVIFGYAYGWKRSFKLDPEKVVNVKLFINGKSQATRSFRILAIEAGGVTGEAPPVNPDSIRTVPPGGVILGEGVKLDPKQVAARGNAKASAEGAVVKAEFTGKTDQAVVVKPVQGKWRLADFTEVRVKLTNTGKSPITPQVRVESPSEPSHNRGPTPWVKADAPLAPGASTEIVVPFGGRVWDGSNPKKTGNSFQSDKTNCVAIAAGDGKGELTIESIRAANPPAQLPDWLGQRPPVEGEWTRTFNEDFDKPLDFHTWNVYTANYWDKRSWFSKDNVIVEDGVAKLRFEKKRGHHNDDPSQKELDYATGYLGTYGKWTQKYGYFEARMKLPTEPGMWPAFWMMPDRGFDKGEQWRRADTKNGGMEFDIMEYLSRWGPARYNIAMHWDGYGKEHKVTGSEAIYVQPDKDGYIVSGVLWEPGKLTFYGNGQVVGFWENERVSSVQMYLIFTAVSGGWDNDPIDDKKLPSDFTIDWVRAWQRKDWASPEDGPKPNDGGLKGPQK